MAQLVVNGHTQAAAYQATSKTKVSKESAKVRASQTFALPNVRARLNWLSLEAKNGGKLLQKDTFVEKTLTDAEKVNEKPAAPAIISRDEIAAKLSDAIRNGNTTEVVSSAAALLKVMPSLADEEKRSADPAAVIATIASFAGMTGEQILRELGGPRFVAEKILATLKLTAIEARDLFQSIVDQREVKQAS